ncbi:MAG TPA: ATP-binding protein [Candidatus Ornithomonoglobus merdipullorum]|uniref:ATP-binding protein n=1 Tax=Candidatus Ornithomonoglobus merdipullorum TaxID=2840895 RepID=A0A9D1SEF6_9FIRM|nr:ATP-binding protein [Candidatus Ornithomonoglobus merdipullorum]
MYIKRALETVVKDLSSQYAAVLITGPRQIGKTTMLKKLMEKEGNIREYVTLDDMEERNLAKNDPAMFFQLHKPPMFIDEIQYAPELFPYIKMQIDKENRPGDFWLTGSQIFKLMEGVQESMAGRTAVLSMSSLSQREIIGAKTAPFEIELDKLRNDVNNIEPIDVSGMFSRIWMGSMPALVSGRYTDRSIFYSGYVSTYIERDVRELSGAIDSMKFYNFIVSAAARAGQLVNYKSIADDADIDQVTAKSWLNIMERLGLIFYLHPYSNNVLKRTIKTPKLYFYDTGLVCYLTKWSSPETAMNGAMSGALFENYVISEIVKSYQCCGVDMYVYYYCDRDAKEIDVLIEKDGKLHPVEIKKTVSPKRNAVSAFEVLDKAALERGTGAVVCMAEKLGAIDRDKLIVPAWII